MTDDAMRAALEAVRKDIGAFTEYGVSEDTEKLIDDALKSGAVDTEKATEHIIATTVSQTLIRAFPERYLKNQILQLPDQIKEQQLLMTKRTAEIEEQRLELDKIKNGHKEFVLSAKEGDKPKFGNDKARDLAVAMLLQDDKAYNDLLDSTRNKERLQRLDEIELKHLEDLFKAYLVVTGMRGVGV